MKFAALVELLIVSILVKKNFKKAFVLTEIDSKYFTQGKIESLKKPVFGTIFTNSIWQFSLLKQGQK